MASREDEKADMLKCGVCLERYRRPKLLPCFHTYCQRCVEKLAGAKPSFPCPACRTVVVIPPGGAANLQANFYIEKDLAQQEASEGHECQLCSKGEQAQYKCVQCQQVYCAPCRGVHDSIESCTQHTILPLDGDAEAGKRGREAVANETKCPKHKNQLRLLFCCRCETSICIQCKLTSHDGHETEDVVDAGTKAKAQLKEECDVLDQRRQLLEAVLGKVDDFHDDLEKEKQAAEQEIRDRTNQLQEMVSQAQDEAMKSVQNTAEMIDVNLKEQAKPVKEHHAAVVARYRHISHVIEEGNADEAVGMLGKLRTEAENTNKSKSQDNLAIQRSTVSVGFRPKTVRYTDVLSFVGTAKEGPVVETKPVGLGALAVQEPVKRRSNHPPHTQLAVYKQKIADRGALPFTEIIYSNNVNSTFQKMCLTNDGRVWVAYNPGGSVYLMSLFDYEGQCLETLYEGFPPANPWITCEGDTVLSLNNGMWVRPGGEQGTLQASPGRGNATISKSSTPYMLWPNASGYRDILRISSTAELPPQIDANPVCVFQLNGTYNFDVSADGKFYAFAMNPLSVYDRIQSTNVLRCFVNYYPADGGGVPIDVCFCEIDGKELLLAAFQTTRSVHVLDHRDGCCFIRTLQAVGCNLNQPMQLATNHQGRVWVGCNGGKIVVFDL